MEYDARFLRGKTQSNTKSLGKMSEIVGGFIAILCKTYLASFEEYKIAREIWKYK